MSDEEVDDERGDPFESFDTPEDREGDPFERLGDIGPDEDSDGATDEPATGGVEDIQEIPAESSDSVPETQVGGDSTAVADEPAFEEEFIDEDDPFATGPGPTTEASPIGGGQTGERDDPLGPDGPFEGMEGREGDPFGEGESVFESVDVESVDAEEVWASLDEEPSTSSVEGSRYVEVSKHRFCEQCEHFSSPPNAHCTHEDAEIIEYLDMETVRLLNCPVVAEQRELEDEG